VGDPALGFVVRPELPPERLPAVARAVEAAGYDELWLWEDCFLGGGIACAGAALAATERIPVGLGIMPAPVRNPAFAAMEIAALARMFPGRIIPGFGHGPADWMRQAGAKPKSQLALLEETVSAVKGLLAGEEVDVDGRYVRLDRVRLDHPPEVVPPVYTGVRRERSLALSGRVADGTILAEPASGPYVEWAREQIAATRPHRLTVYVFWSDDRAALQTALEERIGQGGPAVDMLDADTAAVAGTPEERAATIRALAQAGAESVVLVPATADANVPGRPF
jgi:alkanesulfonate monooxygenase SsuD/methylene tetrahydromethanopterin reductase-like flavin-dependent oxidoreductase (luciferase family)